MNDTVKNNTAKNEFQQTLEILKSMVEVCSIHSSRIRLAHESLVNLIPFTATGIENLSTHALGMTDLLVHRFSKLQDTIGDKIFPLFLTILGENIDHKSFIDRLNMLEKLNIISDADRWREYRSARNAAAHEYPHNFELMADNLNRIVVLSKELYLFWEILAEQINTKIAL